MSSYTEDWPEAVSFRLGLEATVGSPSTVEDTGPAESIAAKCVPTCV